MPKLSALQTNKVHRVLVYGDAKTGKTLLVGSLAKYYNLIWVDMENGFNTLFQLPNSLQEKIELIQIPDTVDFPMAIETVRKIVKGPVSICEPHGKVTCSRCTKDASVAKATVDVTKLKSNTIVVFDSLTQISYSAIAYITKDKEVGYQLTYSDYSLLAGLLNQFLSYIQQATYNVVVIAHGADVSSEKTKTEVIVPIGGTRSFGRTIEKYFDEVVYAEIKNKAHVFSSASTYSNTVCTGSRTGAHVERDSEQSLRAIFKPELVRPKNKIGGIKR